MSDSPPDIKAKAARGFVLPVPPGSAGSSPQEKRRAERAEQQRVRAEKDKERQARREVRVFASAPSRVVSLLKFKKKKTLINCNCSTVCVFSGGKMNSVSPVMKEIYCSANRIFY